MKTNPWIGLASYDEEKIAEGYAFCGRSTATQELYSHVDNNLLVTMYGKSGIGKSSLLKAGLFPKLRGNGYFPVYIRFGKETETTSYSKIITSTICNEIEKAGYTTESTGHVKTSAQSSETDDSYLWNFFASTRFVDSIGNTLFPVVVIDQIEELFFRDKEQLEALFRQIYLLIDDSSLLSSAMSEEVITNYRFLLSIREDDFFRLEDIIERLRLIEMKHNRYRLTELSDSEAKEIIGIPATDYITRGEEEAIAMRIIEAVKGENRQISSAILSLLCSRIYQSTIGRGEKHITLSAVDTFLKGAEGNFLASFYADIIAKLNNRRKWEYIEENLVTQEGRRDSVLKSQFDANVPACDFLFNGEMAMLRCVTYSSSHEPHVEIIHDILAKHLQKSRNERLKKRESLKKWKTAMTFAAIIAVAVFVYQYWTIIKSQEKFLVTQSRYLISEAEKEFDRGNITKALRLSLEALPKELEKPDKPYINEAELMLRKCDKPQKKGIYSQSILQHESYVRSAVFSPDGIYIVTASDDNTARVWDAKTGKPITEPLKHEDYVNSAVFSPDGKYIVTASRDNTARVWDAKTGEPVTEQLKHEDYVNSAVFSPDGEFIVTASGDKTARVWDAKTGKPVTEPLKHEDYVYSAVFSPDGKYIVTASDDNTARVWDAKTGKPVTEQLKHEYNVYSAVFSPDGEYIVTASRDKTARVWEFIPLKEVIEKYRNDPEHDWSLTGQEKKVYSLE